MDPTCCQPSPTIAMAPPVLPQPRTLLCSAKGGLTLLNVDLSVGAKASALQTSGSTQLSRIGSLSQSMSMSMDRSTIPSFQASGDIITSPQGAAMYKVSTGVAPGTAAAAAGGPVTLSRAATYSTTSMQALAAAGAAPSQASMLSKAKSVSGRAGGSSGLFSRVGSDRPSGGGKISGIINRVLEDSEFGEDGEEEEELLPATSTIGNTSATESLSNWGARGSAVSVGPGMMTALSLARRSAESGVLIAPGGGGGGSSTLVPAGSLRRQGSADSDFNDDF